MSFAIYTVTVPSSRFVVDPSNLQSATRPSWDGKLAVELLPLFWYPELLTLIFVSYVIRIRKHLTHTHTHAHSRAHLHPRFNIRLHTHTHTGIPGFITTATQPHAEASIRAGVNKHLPCDYVWAGRSRTWDRQRHCHGAPGTPILSMPFIRQCAVSHSFDWGPWALKRFTSTWFCMFGAPDAI